MIVVIKRGGILLLIMIIIVSFLILTLRKTKPAIAIDSNTVLIDAGHGGIDGGTTGVSGLVEKEVNLEVAKKLSDKLAENGYNVIMTRTEDFGLQKNTEASVREQKREDMRERLNLINGSNASIMVSIHMNHFTDSKYSGPQVFYAANIEGSEELATDIRCAFLEIIGEHCTREIKPITNQLYLLKLTKKPSVIVECGFLSNEEEEKLLSDDGYRQKIAEAICKGINIYNGKIGEAS